MCDVTADNPPPALCTVRVRRCEERRLLVADNSAAAHTGALVSLTLLADSSMAPNGKSAGPVRYVLGHLVGYVTSVTQPKTVRASRFRRIFTVVLPPKMAVHLLFCSPVFSTIRICLLRRPSCAYHGGTATARQT